MKRQSTIHPGPQKECYEPLICHLHKQTKLQIGNRVYHAGLATSIDSEARGQGLDLTAYCPRQ